MLYLAEQSVLVKEKIIRLYAKLLVTFPLEALKKAFDFNKIVPFFISELKSTKQLTVSASLYHFLAVVCFKFAEISSVYGDEISDNLYLLFRKAVDTPKKVELKAVKNMLKAYFHLLSFKTLPFETSSLLNSLKSLRLLQIFD